MYSSSYECFIICLFYMTFAYDTGSCTNHIILLIKLLDSDLSDSYSGSGELQAKLSKKMATSSLTASLNFWDDF